VTIIGGLANGGIDLEQARFVETLELRGSVPAVVS